MNRSEYRDFLSRALSFSSADETFITCTMQDSTSVPFSANRILPTSRVSDTLLQVSVRVGKRYATASGNRTDDASLKALMSRAVEAARVLPESVDEVPFTDPVSVVETPLFKQSNEEIPDTWRIEAARSVIESAQARDLVAGGKAVTLNSVTALANSRGLFLYQPSSQVHVQARATTRDGESTGFSEQRSFDLSFVDPDWVGRSAADKCLAWRNPVEIKPERTTTIFEANVLAEFLLPFLQQFDQQAVEENRTFLRKLDGGNFVGQKLFVDGFDVLSDPAHPAVPSFPFSLDGQRIEKRFWIRNGVIETMMLSRAAARKTGGQPIPFPTNVLMSGGSDKLEKIIASTKRGFLLSGIGNLTIDDPTNCLLTGTTKDGIFLVEEGRITRGVRNLVLRETPLYFFKRMDKVGMPVPAHPRNMFFPMLLPAIRVPEVMYTRLSGVI